MIEPPTPRRSQIITAARLLLEQEGPAALTMRRVADELGIRAPSLYKHLPNKTALENEIIADGFTEAAAAFDAAAHGVRDPLTAFVKAYRSFATAHPHLYRLMTERPLQRDQLPPGLEARTAAPLLHAVGGAARARAAWAFIHGMVMLELNDRFPPDGITEQAWKSGIQAFRPRSTKAKPRATGRHPDDPADAHTHRV